MPIYRHDRKDCSYLGYNQVYGVNNDFYLETEESNGAAYIAARWGDEEECCRRIPLANLPHNGVMSPLSKAARTVFNRWSKFKN